MECHHLGESYASPCHDIKKTEGGNVDNWRHVSHLHGLSQKENLTFS